MEMMRKRNGRVGCVELPMLSTYRESGGDAAWTVTFFITAFSSSHQHCKIEAAKWNENIFYYSKHPEVFFLIHPEGLRYLSKGQDSSESSFPLQIVALGGLEAGTDILRKLHSPSPAACFIGLITKEPNRGSRTGRESTTVRRRSPTPVESSSNSNQSRCSSGLSSSLLVHSAD